MFETMIYWAICLLFVIALILGLAFIVKKFAMPQNAGAPLFGKSRKSRLQVMETLVLDHKSRVILFRRDNIEHLIIVGPTNETVIEAGITPSSIETAREISRDASSEVSRKNIAIGDAPPDNAQKITHHNSPDLPQNADDGGADGGD